MNHTRVPNVMVPSDPDVEIDWKKRALREVRYGFATNTLRMAHDMSVTRLFLNQDFIDLMCLSDMSLVTQALDHLSVMLIEYYDDVRAVAQEYGVEIPELKALETMEATCVAISGTDRWNQNMATWIDDNICCKCDYRLATVNSAYAAGKALNMLLKASKLTCRSTVKVEWAFTR